jgi:hypothetical protein
MKITYEIEFDLPGDFRVKTLESLFLMIKSSVRDRFDKKQVRFKVRTPLGVRATHAPEKHG